MDLLFVSAVLRLPLVLLCCFECGSQTALDRAKEEKKHDVVAFLTKWMSGGGVPSSDAYTDCFSLTYPSDTSGYSDDITKR